MVGAGIPSSSSLGAKKSSFRGCLMYARHFHPVCACCGKYLAENQTGLHTDPCRLSREERDPRRTMTEGARVSSHTPHRTKVPRLSPWRAVRCPSRGSRDARSTARAPAWPPSPGRTPRTSRPCPRRTRSSSGPPPSRSSSRISPSSLRPSRRYVETRARRGHRVGSVVRAEGRAAPRGSPRGSRVRDARTRSIEGDPIGEPSSKTNPRHAGSSSQTVFRMNVRLTSHTHSCPKNRKNENNNR